MVERIVRLSGDKAARQNCQSVVAAVPFLLALIAVGLWPTTMGAARQSVAGPAAAGPIAGTPAPAGADQEEPEPPPSPPSRWRVSQGSAGVILSLKGGSTGSHLLNPVVTGTVEDMQSVSPIFDGDLSGNTVRFKTRSPDGDRTITLVGTVNNDDMITFSRTVEVRPGGDPGQSGFFDVFGPDSFIAVREPRGAGAAPLQRAAATGNVTFNTSLDDDGPLPQLTLYFVRTSTNAVLVSIASRTFTTFLPPGEYRVELRPARRDPMGRMNVGLAPGFNLKSMTQGSTDLLKQPVITVPGTAPINIAIETVSPSPWVRLNGKITGMDASKVKASWIALNMSSNELAGPLIATVKPDGSFEFPKALPGTYQVQLRPVADSYTRLITVTAPGPSVVEIPMNHPSFKVSGRVTDFPTTNTGLQPNQRRDLFGILEPTDTDGQVTLTTAAADGSFSFDMVYPGNYLMSFRSCPMPAFDCAGAPKGAWTMVTVSDRNMVNLLEPFNKPRINVTTYSGPLGNLRTIQ